MVLWMLPKLTDQRTDTSTFTPVSQAVVCGPAAGSQIAANSMESVFAVYGNN